MFKCEIYFFEKSENIKKIIKKKQNKLMLKMI